MRSFICHYVIFSLLFVSLEATTDVFVDGVPHGDDASHQQEFGHPLDAHDGEASAAELDDDHCEHCCHGHSASMTAQVAALAAPILCHDYGIGRSTRIRNFAQAPPTPPPNR